MTFPGLHPKSRVPECPPDPISTHPATSCQGQHLPNPVAQRGQGYPAGMGQDQVPQSRAFWTHIHSLTGGRGTNRWHPRPTPVPPATPGTSSAAGRQRISPPVAARMTRGKVTKVIPSPCGPMPAAGPCRPPCRDAPSSSAVHPGGRQGWGGMQRCQPRRNPQLQPEHCC